MRTKVLSLFNVNRRGSGAYLNLFRSVAMVIMLLLGVNETWAHSNHTGKVTFYNATGNGTVYLSTSNTENTGQSSSSNPGTKNGTSIVTWSCGSSSSGDSKTLYPRGIGNAGYYYLGYATTNNATSGYSTAGKSFDAQSDTDTKIYGYFAEITINNGTASPATIAAEDNSATATTNTCTVTYATMGDNMNDFAGATVGGATGHGTFTAALGGVTSTGVATVNVTFKGDGTYGGNVAAGSRSRTSTAVVTLTSAVGNNKGTCTVTASFPNIVVAAGSADAVSTINTVSKSATATFPVQWADDEDDFSAAFSEISGGGAWTVGEITYTPTDAQSGTITVNYTFNPQTVEGAHSAKLTLSANANAGGASNYVVINAESEALAEYDASIGDTKYTTLAEAITAANGMNTNPTVKILRNIEGLTSTLEIKKPMTIDLNSFIVSGTLTSSVTKLFYLNTATAVLTINDSRNGGKITATGDDNAILYTVLVDKGSLVLTKGDIEIENINTGTSAMAITACVNDGARFSMTAGNLVSTSAGATACGLQTTTAPTAPNMIVITGGSISATTASKNAIGILTQSSSATDAGDPTNPNIVLSNVTINAETTGTTDAFAIRTNPGVCLLINSGTYNATAKTTTARAILTKGYTAIVNGSFNATAGTTDANAIRVEAGIAAVRNGSFKATTVQRIAHAGYVAANAKLLTYGGTFHGKSTAIIANGWATGTQVVSGGTLEAQGGTFIGEVANDGLTAAQTSYAAGIYANTGSNVTLANATLRGLTDNTYVNGAYALYTSTDNPVSLTNCTLDATSTDQYAYGVRLEGGATPLTMNNCTVNATAATLYAYGFYQNNATSTIDVTGSTFNVTSNGTRAYGAYVNNGTSFTATDCDFTVRTLQTSATAAAGSYLRGIFVAAGKTANLTGCTFNVSGHATYSTDAYGLYISGSVNVENTDVTISSVKSGYAILNDGNTAAINIFSGKFSATTAESNATAAAAKQQLYGGFYVHNNNLAKYLPEGYMIETLTAGTEFNAGYKYHVRPETVVNDPVCKIGSIGYATLEEALDFVNKNSGNAYTIYMVKNYTLPAGDYTLPANATLLVPYKTGTGAGATTAIGTTPSRADSYATRSPYRTLTFASGAKMTVYGTIEASAQQNRTDQTSSGEVRGPFGYIILNENASITLEKNAILIAWGFVSGKGTITVKDGAKAYEMLSLGWYKGGNTTLKLYNNKSYKVFVMTDYAYQNIECAITYHPGAQALAAASTDYFSPNDVELVGTSTTSFFKMVKEEASADTWVRKEYDPKTDYTTWTMNNGASMSAIKLDSYSSENFYLPITSNFRIVLNYGEMTLGGDIEFHAGAELIIKKEATGKIASGKTVVFYDGDDWRTGLGSSGKYYYPVTYSPSWKAATGATTNPRLAKYKQLSTSAAPNYLPDAALFVQGKLEVSGNLYTTGDGNTATANRNSNIYSSNDDAGQIIYKTSAPANTSTKTMYKCTAMYGATSGKGITDMLSGGNSTAYPALLQNGDDRYEATGGTAVNSSWIYKNDHWVMVTTEGCFSVEQISGVKHYYAYPAGFVEVSSNTEDANHLYTDAATGNRRFLVDNDCVWWEVEPTPYDDNKYKCVTPDHNGKYKYYEYVSGWQEATVTVTWSINGTNTNYTVLYGTHPKYLSASPTQASTATDYYTWLGWTKGSENGEFFAKDAELPVATENTTYYAYFKADKFTFRAYFNNYDGSVLDSKLVAAGETPIYEGETPVKPATTSKEYTFMGWNPAIAAISNAPVTYTAQFSEKTREYTVQWVNYNGTVLKEEKVAYGTTPTAPSPNPSRPNDAFYTYTFDAWTPAIASVSGDQTYTANYNFEKKVTKYDIIFKNGTETVGSQSLPNGEIPVYGGTTPTKAPTAQYTYTFDGWSETDGGAKITGSLPAVSGANKTYYAHFAASTNNYRIVWKSEDGMLTLETDPTVPYGTTPSFDGTTPTKPRKGATVYTFDGWSATIGGAKIALPSVTGHATYYAHFSDLPVYTVTFDANGHGIAPAAQDVVSGQKAAEPAALSAAEWIFGGWYKEAECINAWDFASDVVTAKKTLYAQWTPAVASVTANEVTTYYATIDDAFTAANNATAASTLTLLQDVTVTSQLTYNNSNNKNCTLDLNGHTLTSNTSEQSPLHINNTNVTFTVTDGTENKSGKILLQSTSSSTIFGAFVDNGTLLLNGGTIEVISGTATTCGVTVYHGTFTVNGGTIHVKTINGREGRGIYAYSTITVNGGTVHVEAAGEGYGIKRDNGTVTVNNGKFNITGSPAYVTNQENNSYVKIYGGYYNIDTKLAVSCATNYHVLPLTGEDPYKYEVAEAYQLAWNLDGGTVVTAGTQAPVNATGTPSGYVAKGATLTAPVVEKTGYTFDGWNTSGGTAAATMPAANTTYTATWTVAESGFWLDIVDVDNSAKTLTLNTTGWASSGWPYTVNEEVYEKGNRKADRTLIIPYTGEVGATFAITVTNKNSVIVSKHNYIIPAEITSSVNLADQQMLYVKSGATLTVNADKMVKNIYVAPGAKLVVNNDITLTADTVFLRTTPWASSELELNGTISGQVCYTRIIKKKDQYYQFGLPMPCAIDDVRLSDGSTPVYGNGWLLRSYSEQHRAQHGSGTDIDNWVTLTNEGADINKTIQGCVGYEMFSNSGYYREYYFPIAHTDLSDRVAVTRTTDATVGAAQEGWNIIVSPLMQTYTQSPAPEGATLSWLQEDGSYWQLPVTEIKPAIPFSYQATQTGYIVFNSNISLPAPQRRVPAAEEYKQIQWLQLDLTGADGKVDETSIYAHPTRYEQTYQTGIDVAKQSLTASRALIYSSHAYGEMAFAGVADALLEQGVALTVYSPKEQELTISMRENEWLDRMAYVWLIDNETGAQIDLLDSDYSFNAEAGTTAGRFILMGAFFAPQITTDNGNVQSDDEHIKVTKFIYNDKMYIQINGVIYDATGKLVK